jgi:Mg/Co/Ni transporter MgtE
LQTPSPRELPVQAQRDKYDPHALPVIDGHGRMVGVVQAEQVISFPREEL